MPTCSSRRIDELCLLLQRKLTIQFPYILKKSEKKKKKILSLSLSNAFPLLSLLTFLFYFRFYLIYLFIYLFSLFIYFSLFYFIVLSFPLFLPLNTWLNMSHSHKYTTCHTMCHLTPDISKNVKFWLSRNPIKFDEVTRFRETNSTVKSVLSSEI